MKRLSFQIITIALGLSLIIPGAVKTQDIDFDKFLIASQKDANTLLSNYIDPGLRGFGYGINGGWYNTAEAHKTLGFDLTLSINAARVPSSAEFFIFNESDYSNISLVEPNNNSIPTLMGPDEDGPELVVNYETEVDGEIVNVNQTFKTPPGVGLGKFNAVPVPTITLGVGLYKGAELKFRYYPKTNNEEFEIDLFGIGILQNLNQWFTAIDSSFDISLFGAMTKADVKYILDDIGLQGIGQEAAFNVDAYTLQVLASKRFSIITFFGGLGYSNAKTAIQLNGTYIIQEEQDVGETISPAVTISNPIDIPISSSGMRLSLGIKLSLAFITLHADYTLQKYHTIGGGIGISIR